MNGGGDLSGVEMFLGNSIGKYPRRNVWISKQDFTSLRIAVMICGSLVNTQAHRHTVFDR